MENKGQDLRLTVAKNIAELRKNTNMTQLGLADALNYTDKAVSKWERGESIPDVVILKRIAELFGVTVDYLLQSEHDEPAPADLPKKRRLFRTHALITGISILLVWFIATFVFLVLQSTFTTPHSFWIAFVYAIPVSMIVWLVLNAIWFDRQRNFFIISVLMWSLLAAIYLNLLICSINIWLIFTLGIPGQIIILLWSGIHRK